LIKKDSLVVDFHTSDAADIPFVIIVDPRMLRLALRTGLKHIVYMKHSPKEGRALINYRDGISIEAGPHLAETTFYRTLEIVGNLQKKHIEKRVQKAYLYEVEGPITKKGSYRNFEPYKEAGETFYPVFTGKNVYGIIGFKARKVKEFSS